MLYLVFRFTDVETIKNLRLIDKYWNEWYRKNKKYLIELYLKREYIGFTTKELFAIAEIVEVNPLQSTNLTNDDYNSLFNENSSCLMDGLGEMKDFFCYVQDFPVHKSISKDFENINEKFILMNDGSIYQDKLRISKLKYAAISCSNKTNICIGLSIDGCIYIVSEKEKKICSVKDIVHIGLAGVIIPGAKCKIIPLKVIDKKGDLIGINITIESF